MRKRRVNTHGSAVTDMSMAAAILPGERNRYAMFLCVENSWMCVLKGVPLVPYINGR